MCTDLDSFYTINWGTQGVVNRHRGHHELSTLKEHYQLWHATFVVLCAVQHLTNEAYHTFSRAEEQKVPDCFNQAPLCLSLIVDYNYTKYRGHSMVILPTSFTYLLHSYSFLFVKQSQYGWNPTIVIKGSFVSRSQCFVH